MNYAILDTECQGLDSDGIDSLLRLWAGGYSGVDSG